MSDRNFENGKNESELNFVTSGERDNSICYKLQKSLRRIAKRLGVFSEEDDSVLGIPVQQVVTGEDDVNWSIIVGVDEVSPGFADRFQNAFEARVNPPESFSKRTEKAQEKAVRAAGSIRGHKPRHVKRGPTRYSED